MGVDRDTYGIAPSTRRWKGHRSTLLVVAQVNDPTLVVPEVDVGGDTERPTPRTGCALADELRASLRARASELPSQADLLLAAASPVDDIRRHAAVCMLQERRALLAVEAAVANPRARL